jgi:hypothetical protein
VIETLALEGDTIAVDRNVPRLLAMALKRYEPGAERPNDRKCHAGVPRV